MPTTVLDPRDSRPLTSREISKVLCSMIGGVATFDPRTAHDMPLVLEVLRRRGSIEHVDAVASKRLTPDAERHATTWAAAFAATVIGLRGWCEPSDVDTALAWVAENISLVIPKTAAPGAN